MWRAMPDSNRQVLSQGLVIQRNKIPDYRTEGLDDVFDTWQIWEEKNLLPFPGTWREQPAHVWDILRAFDGIYVAHMKEKSAQDALAAKVKRH
jgi:hypothetical protein